MWLVVWCSNLHVDVDPELTVLSHFDHEYQATLRKNQRQAHYASVQTDPQQSSTDDNAHSPHAIPG